MLSAQTSLLVTALVVKVGNGRKRLV